MLTMRDVEYGNVLCGAGTFGWFGEGYWYKRLLSNYPEMCESITHVSKTATLSAIDGNMQLNSRYGPKALFPDCIKVCRAHRAILNIVALSNPGLEVLLSMGGWQSLRQPFGISIMSVAPTADQRIAEERKMAQMILNRKHEMIAPFFIQINKSCPNSNENPAGMIDEVAASLEAVSIAEVPMMPKFAMPNAPVVGVMALNDNELCDAICSSNAFPYTWKGEYQESTGDVSLGQEIWGTEQSPLHKYGDGGISGAPIWPYVVDWIHQLYEAGWSRPVNLGGGIMSELDVETAHQTGADSIFVSSLLALNAASLKPSDPQKVVKYANKFFSSQRS